MNFDFIMKLLKNGIEKDPLVKQIFILQEMLSKLPEEKRLELVTDFVTNLENAVKEQEKNEEKKLDKDN